ncbi:hypothetical protein JCM5350_005072 [Sporobolomyces pararoseus]
MQPVQYLSPADPQDQVSAAGSPEDIKERIRAFYSFWIDKTEVTAAPGEAGFEPARVEIIESSLSSDDQTQAMTKWMDEERSAFPKNVLRGCFSYWTQLPGRHDVADELAKGSPLTPFFALFRLELQDEHGAITKAVLVRFLVIRDHDGICRPWTARDPTPRLPALPAPHQKVEIQLYRRPSSPETTEALSSSQRDAPVTFASQTHGPWHLPYLAPGPHQAVHAGAGSTYQGSLRLSSYRKRLAPSPPPEDQRHGKPPHPPSHALSHRQRFTYRQCFATRHL